MCLNFPKEAVFIAFFFLRRAILILLSCQRLFTIIIVNNCSSNAVCHLQALCNGNWREKHVPLPDQSYCGTWGPGARLPLTSVLGGPPTTQAWVICHLLYLLPLNGCSPKHPLHPSMVFVHPKVADGPSLCVWGSSSGTGRVIRTSFGIIYSTKLIFFINEQLAHGQKIYGRQNIAVGNHSVSMDSVWYFEFWTSGFKLIFCPDFRDSGAS